MQQMKETKIVCLCSTGKHHTMPGLGTKALINAMYTAMEECRRSCILPHSSTRFRQIYCCIRIVIKQGRCPSEEGNCMLTFMSLSRVTGESNGVHAALNAGSAAQNSHYKATSSTKLTSRTWGPARSSRTGIRSSNSLSCASENQLLIGTACCGWKIYEVGELSMMMVSRRSRPTWDRS